MKARARRTGCWLSSTSPSYHLRLWPKVPGSSTAASWRYLKRSFKTGSPYRCGTPTMAQLIQPWPYSVQLEPTMFCTDRESSQDSRLGSCVLLATPIKSDIACRVHSNLVNDAVTCKSRIDQPCVLRSPTCTTSGRSPMNGRFVACAGRHKVRLAHVDRRARCTWQSHRTDSDMAIAYAIYCTTTRVLPQPIPANCSWPG